MKSSDFPVKCEGRIKYPFNSSLYYADKNKMVLIILNSSFFFYYFSIFSKIISHLVKSIFSHKKFEKLRYLYS